MSQPGHCNSVLLRVVVMAACVLTLSSSDALAKRRRGTGYEGPNPCTRMTVEVVEQALALKAPDAKAEQGSFAKEVCTLRWAKPNAAAIEAQLKADMMAHFKAQQEALKAGKPAPKRVMRRTHNEVTITLGRKLFTSKEEAARALKGALDRLDKGFSNTQKTKGPTGGEREVTATFQAGSVPVQGVGDGAYWTPKLHQLAVVDGKGFFYVSVRVDDDDRDDVNQAQSIKVAKALLTGSGGR